MKLLSLRKLRPPRRIEHVRGLVREEDADDLCVLRLEGEGERAFPEAVLREDVDREARLPDEQLHHCELLLLHRPMERRVAGLVRAVRRAALQQRLDDLGVAVGRGVVQRRRAAIVRRVHVHAHGVIRKHRKQLLRLTVPRHFH